MSKCVILQPSYIPWRGYFHQIQKADLFIFYDDVQYDKNGWRNRNRIKTSQGTQWLTIPVLSKGNLSSNLSVNKVHLDGRTKWNQKHLTTLKQTYGKAPFFGLYKSLLESFYTKNYELLADFTIDTTIALARELGIEKTEFLRSSSLPDKGEKTGRLISILKSVGATHYISGPAAKDYIEEEKFSEAGITLEYMSYNYPEYTQLYPPFDPQVSILDLLFMTGENASKYIWGKVPE